MPRTVCWKAAKGSSSGSALGSHPSRVLQLSHETVYFTATHENHDLPTPREVTEPKAGEGPAVLTGPLNRTPLVGPCRCCLPPGAALGPWDKSFPHPEPPPGSEHTQPSGEASEGLAHVGPWTPTPLPRVQRPHPQELQLGVLSPEHRAEAVHRRDLAPDPERGHLLDQTRWDVLFDVEIGVGSYLLERRRRGKKA